MKWCRGHVGLSRWCSVVGEGRFAIFKSIESRENSVQGALDGRSFQSNQALGEAGNMVSWAERCCASAGSGSERGVPIRLMQWIIACIMPPEHKLKPTVWAGQLVANEIELVGPTETRRCPLKGGVRRV